MEKSLVYEYKVRSNELILYTDFNRLIKLVLLSVINWEHSKLIIEENI